MIPVWVEQRSQPAFVAVGQFVGEQGGLSARVPVAYCAGAVGGGREHGVQGEREPADCVTYLLGLIVSLRRPRGLPSMPRCHGRSSPHDLLDLPDCSGPTALPFGLRLPAAALGGRCLVPRPRRGVRDVRRPNRVVPHPNPKARLTERAVLTWREGTTQFTKGSRALFDTRGARGWGGPCIKEPAVPEQAQARPGSESRRWAVPVPVPDDGVAAVEVVLRVRALTVFGCVRGAALAQLHRPSTPAHAGTAYVRRGTLVQEERSLLAWVRCGAAVSTYGIRSAAGRRRSSPSVLRPGRFPRWLRIPGERRGAGVMR